MRSTTTGKLSISAAALLMGLWLGGPSVALAQGGLCGQPISTGAAPTATDALFVLRVAVGVASCDACVCDVDSSGGATPVTATDALKVLKRAVDATVVLTCTSCTTSVSCFDNSVTAPTCGGTCPSGLTCAEDPFEPGFCECLNACDLSAVPTCGGSCAAEGDPNLTCQVLGISTDGGPIESLCTCAPSVVQLCSEGSAPTCAGLCQPGAQCVATGVGSACACELLPTQPACASASAPACAGTCPDGFICESGAGGCGCAVFSGQSESCFDAGVPVCGGTCAFGELCSSDILGVCECFTPCELSTAPVCGGSCPEPGTSCVVQVLTVGGKMLDICACD